MLEKDFRARLVAELKIAGKEAFPVESATSPGFPDLVIAGFTTSLAELKVVATRASKATLHDLFEATQRAFQKRWWTTQAGGLWLALYDKHDEVYQALQLSPDMLDKPLGSVLGYGIMGKTLPELVKRWRQVL